MRRPIEPSNGSVPSVVVGTSVVSQHLPVGSEHLQFHVDGHLESGNICGERIERFREATPMPMVATDSAFLPIRLRPHGPPFTWLPVEMYEINLAGPEGVMLSTVPVTRNARPSSVST